ncbi:MAG: metallophosphoesterase family protein [Terriglobia bacterium]
MRYLLLSDVHSNIEALDVCLEFAQGKHDQAVCLGDLVGYGPNPNEVIEKVRGLTQVIIRGNHDKACCGLDDAAEFNPFARLATEWTRQALTPEHIEYLRSLPTGPKTMEGFVLVHGSPVDEDEYILGPGQALPLLRGPGTQIVCYGHTHYQGGFMLTPTGRFQSVRFPSKPDGLTLTLPLENTARYLINPGSVGQPRDGDGRAAFAILDMDKPQVEYYRLTYDLAKTQAKMKQAGLPEPLCRRLELGR